MKPNFSRSVLMIVTMLGVFVFGAILTAPAYADDTTPPPTETPTEMTPPVDESTPTAADPAPVAEETVAELLTQVPEGTELVVVNDEGETIPLASEEAAQLVETVDPMWCPAGVNPGAAACSIGYTSLTQLVTDFNDGAGGQTAFVPSGNGVIWIQKDADPGTAGTSILMNGSIGGFISIANFSLTLKGGWNGCNPGCVNTIDVTHPSIFDQSLSIINWNGDVTLSDITFSGVTVGSASNNAALNIQTSKKITLKNVKVNNNSGGGSANGAWLDNADADSLVFGDVYITNSTFNDNKNVGLTVNSEGTITLANVLVNGNDVGGAYLKNTFAASAKAVTIVTGTNEFNNNIGTANGDGLNIQSKGAITLKDITANDNGRYGVFADNHLAVAALGVTLTGTNVFSGNTDSGLIVNSRGAISASNLIANGNTNGWGAKLDNSFAATPQTIKIMGNNEFKFNGYGLFVWSNGAITTNNVVATNNSLGSGVELSNDTGFFSSVTMTGVNIFTDNKVHGLEIITKGAIILNNITAYGNGLINSDGFGVYLNNSEAITPMAVTISGTNTFNNNYSGGLEIHSKGTVTLSKVTASNNTQGGGAWIKNDYGDSLNPQNVTLTTANTFIGNYGIGLVVDAYGAITIANLTANENGRQGASLHNYGGVFPKATTLTGTNKFNDNGDGGLIIHSKGAITLSNATANNNAGFTGVYLGNSHSTLSAPQNITLTGTNQFNGNGLSGLEVDTYGVVLLSKVTASENLTGYGVQIYAITFGDPAALPKAVMLTGYGVFNHNLLGGLYIDTKGAITLNNVTANNNTAGHGVRLDSRAGTGLVPNVPPSKPLNVQNVTINGTNQFNGNFDSGLWVYAWGAILTNNLTANDNGGYGAMLDNFFDDSVMTFKPVTLNGVNVFNGNKNHMVNPGESNPDTGSISGLHIVTTGKITINKLDASNNLGRGATLNSFGSAASSGITMTGWVYADNNADIGFNAFANGNITVANLNIKKGSGDSGAAIGAILDASNNGNITLSGINQIFGTASEDPLSRPYGLTITTSGGSVTLSSLTVSGNEGSGVTIDTTRAGNVGPQNVTLTGFNTFWQNGDHGLYIKTYGAVTISNLDVYNNGGTGVEVNVLAAKNVTITGSNFFESNEDVTGPFDQADGLAVGTLGAISISNLHSKDNERFGAVLSSGGGITLTGVNSFENNGASGLLATSSGAISMSNLTAVLNKENGVWLDNYSVSGTTAVAVTLTGVNTFISNGNAGVGSGLVISAGGQITLSNVTASRNQASGAILENYSYTASLVVKPGIKLTGLNIFNLNRATGLDIHSRGGVDLVNITADDNGVANGADGVHAETDGTFTMACGSMNVNTGSGWDLTANGLITLKGVFGFGNTSGNVTSSPITPVTSRACPVPAPVVVPPVDNSDDEPHGSNRTAPVFIINPYYKE